MTILVTGATGAVGRLVVAELLNAGQHVRALTRTPAAANLPDGVEVVGGDLEDPASLEGVFDGVDRMYLFPIGRTAREVVAAAKQTGVRRIVVLSGAMAGSDDGPGGYLPVERAVEDSGLEWTHVRPGEFALNWLGWAAAIKAERVVRRPYGGAVTQPTHEADVAAVAATVLVEDGHAGRKYTLAGPEALTTVAQAHAIGAAIGDEVRFEELDPVEARGQWIRDGYPEAFVDWIFMLWAESARHPEPVNEEWASVVPRLTGRPARTFAEWATDHSADFR
ncbi:NAD(P)H-binding protein [Plantactinospora sp. S1510]|uniref:NAD(P)H-binding protein n=1 Tax=Plantactinospora alkalitolerans TaxID=2789879 RepID=A0ABS0GW99_9ACTN|nr:NAD(P)H-binding protein [Plantactinospora alkalitolerans]MBF9130489.1 NAD(P)H-binding protein [Plantactinospora alkalitolerans]